MKSVFLGDTHLGVRGDSMVFAEHFALFYEKVLFPEMEKRKINHLIQFGDLFDRRKFVNYEILDFHKRRFFDYMLRHNISFHTLLGNHDIYHKNTLRVNSPYLLLKEYENIIVYDKPKLLEIYEGQYTTAKVVIDVIPWVCDENRDEVKDFMKHSESQVCFGHFEVSGFEMEKGRQCITGIDRTSLKQYRKVYSGHFHHKSDDGHVYYLGSPYEMMWSDWDDVKGFYIYDHDSEELEFIQNPYHMFYKLPYDDKKEITFDKIKKWKQQKIFNRFHNTYVKVIVQNKQNPFLFETFMDMLFEAAPKDVTIVEDYSELILNANEKSDIMKDATKDTFTLLSEYVDDIELEDNDNIQQNKLKNVLSDIYKEALNMEISGQ